MEPNSKKIDDLFKDELGDYAEVPPPAAWDALEKKLKAVPPGVSRFSGKKFGYFAMVCLVLMLTIPLTKQIPGLLNTTDDKITQNKTIHASQNKTTTGNDVSGTEGPGAGNNDPEATAAIVNENKKQSSSADKDNSRQNNRTQAVNDKKRLTGNKKNAITSKAANGNADNETEEAQQPENTYNSSTTKSSLANPSPEENTTAETVTAKKETNEPTKKEDKANSKPLVKNPPPKPPKPKFNRFEAGIKAGYERGFDNDAARKFVVSPYMQFNISPKFSIMTQPAVKFAMLDTRRIGKAKSYYKANSDSIIEKGATNPVYVDGITNPVFYITNYRYTQTHDSIVKTNTIGTDYFELDVPVLFKYYIAKQFSVYGGINLTYSKLTAITEHTYTKPNLKAAPRDSFAISLPGQEPVPPPVNSVITHKGTSYADYTGPQYPTTTQATWRAGYMIGFTYELNKRLLVDALIQQSDIKPLVQEGYNVNTTLSAPYFRFTIGYKLLK